MFWLINQTNESVSNVLTLKPRLHAVINNRKFARRLNWNYSYCDWSLQPWMHEAPGHSLASMDTPTQCAESSSDKHTLRRCCCPSWQYFLLLHSLHGPQRPHTAKGRKSKVSKNGEIKQSSFYFLFFSTSLWSYENENKQNEKSFSND